MLSLPACIHDTELEYEITLNKQMDKDWISRSVNPHESIHSLVITALIVKMIGM